MKSLWNALAIVLVINLLLVVGGVGYLYLGGRLSGDRARQAAAIFAPTLEEEQQMARRVADQAALDAERAKREAHRRKVADGPVSTREKIDRDVEAEEIALLQVQRLREEIRALQRQLDLARQSIARQKAEHDAERVAWEASIADELARRTDADFQKTVALYQQLKPKQAKDMFMELIGDGQGDQVVEYLAAMQQRKAAGVLKEFKSPEELAVASRLLERLRERGVDMLSGAMGRAMDQTAGGQATDLPGRHDGAAAALLSLAQVRDGNRHGRFNLRDGYGWRALIVGVRA